jgi:SEC-C motif-containing protein
MRSRFTAYAVGDVEYLLQTTHPTLRTVGGLSEADFRAQTAAWCAQTAFVRLEVRRFWPPDPKGISRVLFIAHLEVRGRPVQQTELSEFCRLDGRWVYAAGRPPRLDELG